MEYNQLSASDGTGEAVLANIESDRSIGAVTLDVDSVENFPNDFIFATGTKNANNFITPASMTVGYGHVDSGNVVIDGFAPGYSDVGNTAGQILVIKPTTYWADEIVRLAKVAHNNDGTIKNDAITTHEQFTDPVDPVKRASESQVFDYVASGVVLAGTGYGSTLAWTLSAGVVYINGKRLTYAGGSGSVTASKDTYFDLLDNGDGTAVLVNTGGNIVNNNAASPALAANSVRVGIIQAGANIASVAAVNQGQRDKVLPIASSMPYMVTDSLGNLICPRDPARKVLGYRRIASTVGPIGTSGTDVDVAGVAVPFIADGVSSVRATLRGGGYSQTGGIGTVYGVVRIREGSTRLGANQAIVPSVANFPEGFNTFVDLIPSAGLHTYKMSVNNGGGTGPNFSIGAASDDFTIITVERA